MVIVGVDHDLGTGDGPTVLIDDDAGDGPLVIETEVAEVDCRLPRLDERPQVSAGQQNWPACLSLTQLLPLAQ